MRIFSPKNKKNKVLLSLNIAPYFSVMCYFASSVPMDVFHRDGSLGYPKPLKIALRAAARFCETLILPLQQDSLFV